jgi:hypothetical protein
MIQRTTCVYNESEDLPAVEEECVMGGHGKIAGYDDKANLCILFLNISHSHGSSSTTGCLLNPCKFKEVQKFIILIVGTCLSITKAAHLHPTKTRLISGIRLCSVLRLMLFLEAVQKTASSPIIFPGSSFLIPWPIIIAAELHHRSIKLMEKAVQMADAFHHNLLHCITARS